MMLLVNHSPTSLEPYRHPNLGVLCSPRNTYGDNITTWRWAADNDAYSDWDEGRYRAMLDRIRGRSGCLFVTAPDVVADANATLKQFWHWYYEIQDFPVAFVLQDGVRSVDVPWGVIDAVFIGGTDTFKMGDYAARIVREAKDLGKWVHMGRVNGHRRLMYAKAIGCHSVDGTSFSWFRDTWLRQFLDHASQPPQMMLA